MTYPAYKLVDQDGYTRRGASGETLWLPVGTRVAPTGVGSAPCGPGVLHGYIEPEVAVLANPIHARIIVPRLLRIESGAPWQTDGLKRWTTHACNVVVELPLPTLTTTELVAWVICISPHATTREWAARWLSGEDRSYAAAACAAEAAKAAAWAAAAARAAADVRVKAEAAADAVAMAAKAAAWAAAKAEAAAAEAAEVEKRSEFEFLLLPTLRHARAILAGEIPAERYAEMLTAATEEVRQ